MSIKEIKIGDLVTYQVRVYFRSKRNPRIRVEHQKSGVKTEAEARRIERQLTYEAHRTLIQKEQEGIPWAKLVGDWEMALREGTGSDRPIGRATAFDYIRALELYTDVWMSRPVEEITHQDVRMVINHLKSEGLSNSRQRAVINAINGLYRWGQNNGFISDQVKCPTAGITISRIEDKKPMILTLNEIRLLIKSAKSTNHPWYYIWTVALLTGARSGELFALEWVDVDLENRKLILAKSYNRRFRQIKSTKGGYWREVPISNELERILKELRALNGTSKHVFPHVYGWERGESARVLRAFCEGIGIPSVTFHTLRACFATHLLRAKVAPAVVMKICGWRDLKTMQRYIRLAGIEIDGATDGLKILPAEEAMDTVVQLYQKK